MQYREEQRAQELSKVSAFSPRLRHNYRSSGANTRLPRLIGSENKKFSMCRGRMNVWKEVAILGVIRDLRRAGTSTWVGWVSVYLRMMYCTYIIIQLCGASLIGVAKLELRESCSTKHGPTIVRTELLHPLKPLETKSAHSISLPSFQCLIPLTMARFPLDRDSASEGGGGGPKTGFSCSPCRPPIA